MISAPPVRLVDQRRYDPPRRVQIEHFGRWWNGWLAAWRICDDGRGWMADVEWVELYEWGLLKHLGTVPPERVRP